MRSSLAITATAVLIALPGCTSTAPRAVTLGLPLPEAAPPPSLARVARVSAQEPEPQPESEPETELEPWPTFELRGGLSLLHDFDTDFGLTSEALGTGGTFDFEKGLGLDRTTDAFRIDFVWRPARRHSFNASYFEIERSSDVFETNREIQWGEVTFPVNASVRSLFKVQVAKLAYRYSFVATDELDIAGSLGVHADRIKAGINGQVNGVALGQDFSQPVPMPMIGAHMVWRITDGWSARVSAETFYIKLESAQIIRELDMEGFLLDGLAAIEYELLAPLGVGLAYNIFYLRGDYGDRLLRLDGRYRYNGAMLYAVLSF